jgi:hypothetical protein
MWIETSSQIRSSQSACYACAEQAAVQTKWFASFSVFDSQAYVGCAFYRLCSTALILFF